MNKLDKLAAQLEEQGIQAERDKQLAPYTTWKVGGPADLFVISKSSAQLKLLIEIANNLNVPTTVLGWGSNTLVADEGIRGLVIRNQSTEIEILHNDNHEESENKTTQARLDQVNTKEYYSFEDITYDEIGEKCLIRIDSGVGLAAATTQLINKNLTGLQWFAGIPGTIGGAIYNNIHGGSHFFEQYVAEVTSIDKQNKIHTRSQDQLKFDYDYSIFHELDEVILEAKILLTQGDKERALDTYRTWAIKKKQQPYNSAGCCFKNIDPATKEALNLESSSWGHIIEHKLGLKGKQIGKAKISEYHAAFIETEPGAKAADVLQLMDLVYENSKKKLGITPQVEIFFHGFEPTQVQKHLS